MRTWLRTDPANFPFKTPEDVLAYLGALGTAVLDGSVDPMSFIFGRRPG